MPTSDFKNMEKTLFGGRRGPEFKDYYKTLGVDQSAGQDKIKRVFRKLAREHHPDVNKASGSEARFKEISEAYEVLGDAKKRAEYDQLYAYWKNGGAFPGQPGFGGAPGFRFQQANSHIDLEELFNSLFGDSDKKSGGATWFGGFPGTSGAGESGFSRAFSPSQAHEVEISLEEAFRSCKRQFEVHTPGESNKRIQVTIPVGTTDGQTIRMGAKQRNSGMAGEDLLLKIRISPHRHFRVEGKDVHLELPIAPWESALGATVTVPTLGGPVHLKIPPGSQSGKKLALKGRGLPGTPAGAQYVTLHVIVPEPKTESHRELYKRMEREMPFDPRGALIQ